MVGERSISWSLPRELLLEVSSLADEEDVLLDEGRIISSDGLSFSELSRLGTVILLILSFRILLDPFLPVGVVIPLR